MKNLKLVSLLIASLFVLGFQSCKDECKDVTCLNGGTCDEETGECICLAFYEGANCGTALNERFAGQWTAVDSCVVGVPNYVLTIETIDGHPDSIKITGIEGIQNYVLRGTVSADGMAFSFPKQNASNFDAYSSVSSSLSSDYQTLNLVYNYYSFGSSTPSRVCSVTAQK